MAFSPDVAEAHFDAIAGEYDFWKKKNWYYYQNLKALYRAYIPPGSRVLEIGCGTGDILSALEPAEGLGIDISSEMIALATKKHAGEPALSFKRLDVFEEDAPLPYPYLFSADVLEHVGDASAFMRQLAKRTEPGARIVISLANPLWEPILMLAEKCGMKMPEGPHERLDIRSTEKIFRESGLALVERGYRLLIPKPLPFSDAINRYFYRVPFLAPLGFIVFWVLTKQ